MVSIDDDRVVVVTGAGRGLGRAYALAFAAAGARVVVNDLGTDISGRGSEELVASMVVQEIRDAGGQAIADTSDITTPEGAKVLVERAIGQYGKLDVLVCNAGAYHVDWLWETSVEQWDRLMRVHLRGLFCPTTCAIEHWRARHSEGETLNARLICITSQSGLFGAAGSAAYDTAKAGVAGFVIVAAKELQPLGITVNAVAPRAQTRMSDMAADRFARLGVPLPGDGSKEANSALKLDAGNNAKRRRRSVPDDVAPLLVWLGGAESGEVTGRTFSATAGRITLIENWANGPSVATDRTFSAASLGPEIHRLIREADS